VQLVITGVHQRTAPVAVRERLAFSIASTPDALNALRAYASEGFILSTCNRVEVYGLVGHDTGDRVLRQFLAEWHHLAPEELMPHAYTFTGADAVRHAFRLAAGLDSMVLGEEQILAQLKAALARAQAAGTAGQLISRLLQSALAAGKLVRTRTGIARNPVSVVSVALDMARDALGGLAERHVLVIGAGRMAELALKHLRSAAPRSVAIVNRTIAHSQALAAAYGAQVWPFEHLVEALHRADVAISCTAAPDIILSADAIARALDGRDTGLLLLDLAVPRDIDRQAAAIPGVRLIDVDDLQAVCAANRAARASEVAAAEALVESEVARFMEWWATQEVVPTIRALRERAEAIRVAELERTLAKLPDLSPREQQAIQALSAAIVNKLLHQPIASLKDPTTGSQLAQVVQQLFQLKETV
jgi:glutamyl-tRNA reductase